MCAKFDRQSCSDLGPKRLRLKTYQFSEFFSKQDLSLQIQKIPLRGNTHAHSHMHRRVLS